MPSQTLTFQAMLEGCSRRDIASWRYFSSKYGSLTEHLLTKRFGDTGSSFFSLLPEFFSSLSEHENVFLKDFSGSEEREFLIPFQSRLFDFARSHVKSVHPPGMSLTSLREALGRFPLAHQEAGWLALKGYVDEVIGKVLRVPVSLVKTGRVEVLKGFSACTDSGTGMWRLNDPLLSEVEKCGGPNCPETKAFCKVMDGQMPWQDKRNIEQHIAQCLYCLDRETSLKEATFHQRNLPPLSEEVAQSLLSHITFAKSATVSQKSILEKVLKVFR